MKKAQIFYTELPDEMKKEDKFSWFWEADFARIPFERITPDKRYNWINQTDNDFEELMPLMDKDVKRGKSQEAIFKLFSSGIKSQRDEWVYDFSRESLKSKAEFFAKNYQQTLENENFKDKFLIQ